MSKYWEIAKEFTFEYGHRVWVQELNGEYSLDTKCACRHHHGHSGKVIVYLKAEKLENGFVTDFKHLNWFKKFLDDNLDHKMILDSNDPFNKFYLGAMGLHSMIFEHHKSGFMIPDLREAKFESDAQREIAEGVVFVPFVPTSENLCLWLQQVVEEKMRPLGVTVSKIQFFETAKSQSNYVSI